jgi:hypothetical protein
VFQKYISLQIISIQKNILFGFAKQIKFLSVPKVRPLVWSIYANDFQNLEREKIPTRFSFLNNFFSKIVSKGVIINPVDLGV